MTRVRPTVALLVFAVALSAFFSGCKSKCVDGVDAVREGMTPSEISQLLGEPSVIKREPGILGTPGTETWIWVTDCSGGVGYRVTFLAEEWVGPSGKFYPAGWVSGWGVAIESGL